MKSTVSDACSGLINMRLKGNTNIKIVWNGVRIKLKTNIISSVPFFLQQNDTLDAILVVKIPIFQSFHNDLKCQNRCLQMFIPHVFLSLQNATSINPAVQLSAVQAARWGNTRVNTQRLCFCVENDAHVFVFFH